MFLRFMWNNSAHSRRCQNIYQLEESELKQFSFKQIQEKVKNLGKKIQPKLDQQKSWFQELIIAIMGWNHTKELFFFS